MTIDDHDHDRTFTPIGEKKVDTLPFFMQSNLANELPCPSWQTAKMHFFLPRTHPLKNPP